MAHFFHCCLPALQYVHQSLAAIAFPSILLPLPQKYEDKFEHTQRIFSQLVGMVHPKYLADMGVACSSTDPTTNACISYLPAWVLRPVVSACGHGRMSAWVLHPVVSAWVLRPVVSTWEHGRMGAWLPRGERRDAWAQASPIPYRIVKCTE